MRAVVGHFKLLVITLVHELCRSACEQGCQAVAADLWQTVLC